MARRTDPTASSSSASPRLLGYRLGIMVAVCWFATSGSVVAQKTVLEAESERRATQEEQGRRKAPPPLEDLMTRDEIFANLIAEPDLKPYPPKRFLEQEPYALPFGPDDLAYSPQSRMLELVPEELRPYFDLFLYVNKAERGIWAQQMFIFERRAGTRIFPPPPPAPVTPEPDPELPEPESPDPEEAGSADQAPAAADEPQPAAEPEPREDPQPTEEPEPFERGSTPSAVSLAGFPGVAPDEVKPALTPMTVELTDRWLVSTGRERRERYFTNTPTGLFRLDENRMYRFVRSYQWNGAPMPFAMFFDYDYRTRKSGYAIHAASRRYERFLGRRASGGCVRLSLAHAEELFERVREGYEGYVPDFPRHPVSGYTRKDGVMMRDDEGRLVVEPGYRVLLVIDDLEQEVL